MVGEEQRKLERVRLTITLPILEKESENIIGTLEDITPQGVRLTCNDELKADEIYQLAMELPADMDAGQKISFKARCVWCKIDDTINVYHAGLELESAEGENERIIGQLIEKYATGE